MSNFQPVTSARHSERRWHRYDHYGFAASTALVPLAAAEVVKAALSLPLAFVENEGEWTLAAVLSLLPGQNLYIAPNGNWIASYVPAAFRSYPFRVGWNEAGQAALCVDEGSGLVVEGTEGETFFDEDGKLGPALTQVWSFLQEALQSGVLLTQACGHLHTAGVIERWPITIQDAQGSREVPGLYRINEGALNALNDAAFGALRMVGVVGIAYAQLLSMGNIEDLGKLVQARAQAEAAERARAEQPAIVTLPDDSSIDWDWSKVGKL